MILNHTFQKIKDFLSNNKEINAIWYCVTGNRLDGDEDYIEKLLKLYSFKIPIIFLYTKANSIKEEEIESIKEGLSQFSFLKENPNNFHFLEIISRDFTNKKGEIKEKAKGLNELIKLTIDLSEKSFKCEIYQIINQYYNEKAEKILKDLSEILKTQNNDIIVKKAQFESFKKYINDIFNCSYGNFLNI